ncbi:hypothetical protein [Bacillus sp. T3]|uniref:hypothetical protein n=1 Tax=Bacillus sp. T3 TaxID=467262 RepID=UPI0029811983|nr:hypothetical protein [Bacillus sp. T3]
MSVKKVKISQLQQEGKEFLKKQRLKSENKQAEPDQNTGQESVVKPLGADNMNHMNQQSGKKVPLVNKTRQMQTHPQKITQQAMTWNSPELTDEKEVIVNQNLLSAKTSIDVDVQQLEQDILDLNEAGSVLFKIPVFFSHQNLTSLGPDDPPPLSQEQQFILQLFKELKRVLLLPRTLTNSTQYPDTRLENISNIIKSSFGTIAVLLEQTQTSYGEPYTPFSQFEPAMAYQKGHPLLLVMQDTMTLKAGGVWDGVGSVVPFSPIIWHSEASSVEEFFNSYQWNAALYKWANQVRNKYNSEGSQA